MPATFWSNTIWYVLLTIISIISIVLILCKSNNRKFNIGFILTILGATFHVEFVLLPILNAYRYFPKIFNDLFVDSVLGNYVSQISVTATVVLATAYRIPTVWYLVIAGIYFLIEELFINLGIYQHNWYKTWYTSILILPLLWLSRKWYNYLQKCPKSIIYTISLYLGARAAFSLMIVFKFFLSIEVYNVKTVFSEFTRNNSIFSVPAASIWIIIMVIIHQLNIKWIWKGGFFVLLFIIQYVLIKIVGVITIKDGWFLIITLLNIFGSYLSVVITDHLLSKGIATNSQK